MIEVDEVNYFRKPLAEAWYPLKFHRMQRLAYEGSHRFIGLDCGRGSGKTEISRRRIIRALAVGKPWPDPIYFYALPTFAQAKKVAWGPLLNLLPYSWIRKVSESGLTIETVFNSKLIVVGLDKPERVEGMQYDGGVVDESSDTKPHSWARSIIPALTHRMGWGMRIGVPKRYGVGAAAFKDFCIRSRAGEIEESIAYNWPSGDILSPEQLELFREQMDERDFNEQFNANWESAGGAIFHAFGAWNIRHTTYGPQETIIVGSDFNVNPMCWTLSHVREAQLETFDEIHLRDTNTQATLNELHRRYGDHLGGWLFIGDASARARKTSASMSDYIQIKNDNRFKNKRVRYDPSNPRQTDRFASCNGLFKNARDEVRYRVDPKCKYLIQDLESRSFKEGSNEPDDESDQGHMSDALGYVIHALFPIKIETLEQQSIVSVPGVG